MHKGDLRQCAGFGLALSVFMSASAAGAQSDGANSLSLTGPTITGPKITGPRVTGPSIKEPKITGPRIQRNSDGTVSVIAPKVEGPQVTALLVAAPVVEGPKMTGPVVRLPQFAPPRITLPEITDQTATVYENETIAIIRLSGRRAAAVAQWFIGAGLLPERMSIVAQGESMPVALNTNADGSDNPVGRQLNRRVEIAIARKPGG